MQQPILPTLNNIILGNPIKQEKKKIQNILEQTEKPRKEKKPPLRNKGETTMHCLKPN